MSRHQGFRAALGVLVLLAASLALAHGARGDKKDAKETPPDYYPLQVGNEWHYTQTQTGGQTSKVVTRVTKMETLDGQALIRLERPDAKYVEHLFQNEKGVFRARSNGAVLTPAVQVIAYPAKPGAKWKGEFAFGKEKAVYAGEIQKEESIKVPAGEFSAVRVHVKLEQSGENIDMTFWFAKDVGLVKQTMESAGSTFTMELEKFERKK